MREQKVWDVVRIMMIALILSFPFYSASALAALSIERNSGEDVIEGYLDGEGDIWTVEALISGNTEEVLAEEVLISLGGNEEAFAGCSNSDFGTTCTYISPLTAGIPADTYEFQVKYGTEGDAGVIIVDGSSPSITFTSAVQAGSELQLDFSVEDENPCVGLEVVEVLDGVSNEVIASAQDIDGCSYDFSDDENYLGKIPGPFSGEGTRLLKIRASDAFGHETTSRVLSVSTDFIAPEIVGVNYTHLGKFIGTVVVPTDITVDVRETNQLTALIATSENVDFAHASSPSIVEDSDEPGLWHVTWSQVEVLPESVLRASFTAIDAAGNEGIATLSTTLTPDTVAPQVLFFGTDKATEERSYANPGENKVILVAEDAGAGISVEGVRADLGGLGGSGTAVPVCEEVDALLLCTWDVNVPQGADVGNILLTKFEDNVGNPGELVEVAVIRDDAGPRVESLAVYGGTKGYFQSGDALVFDLTVIEQNPVQIAVNLNEAVLDAENMFPAGYVREGFPDAGWMVVQDACVVEEGRWRCQFETPTVKSGPDAVVDLDVMVLDMAGNEAEQWPEVVENLDGRDGHYSFELFGVTNEEAPDYWEVSRRRGLLDFVDLDTVGLGFTRYPVEVTLDSDFPQATVLSLEMVGCLPASNSSAPQLSRQLLYGTEFAEGNPEPVTTLILEFAQFMPEDFFTLEGSFTGETVHYTCELAVGSKIGNDALANLEIQQVDVSVPFAFSELGAVDENIKQRINEVWDTTFMEIAGVLSVIDEVLNWIRWVTSMLQVVVSVNTFVNLFGDTKRLMADQTTKVTLGLGEGIATALRGGCYGATYATEPSWKFVEYIQIPVQILSCNPNIGPSRDDDGNVERDAAGNAVPIVDLGWYAAWQKWVLTGYNLASGRGVLGIPATSLYDNLYVSSLGLCVPGIIHNLNKAREIGCRKIVCYGRDVPQGLATIDQCDDLYDLQMCEYFLGPAFDMFLFGGIASIGDLLKNAFSSPLGLISLTETLGCATLCFVPDSPGALTACKVTTGLNKVLGIINSLVDIITNPPWGDTGGRTPFCDQAENIDVDEL